MRIFCELCRLQNLPITCTELNGRFTSEQSSINLQHESESSLEPFWLTNPCYFPFLSIDKQKWTTPNSLTQWRSTHFLIFFTEQTRPRVSLLGFSTSICPPPTKAPWKFCNTFWLETSRAPCLKSRWLWN